MAEQPPEQHDKQGQQLEKPNILQVFLSVLAALFGVQKNAIRERDFKKGSAVDFIAVYVVLVIAFVIGMIMVVNTVISSVK